ncbi:RnfABCDGE type electron transport complex subunit D [Flammeovirga sp. EKP202]|uniref:RnfABCDGE type electron transport complex subunit D n=1 Tax=Flammeovirga sp. EKP202 TaxID=2770592 RepID=UPI00165FEF54|nr:RnfABCDGE type electron transport complex subunit D [Flammeovirga sp. EKP202]MBD0401762.1 RnfABCDGE type electron transport complex subunit D [Flammeovirga sp. EKP202]
MLNKTLHISTSPHIVKGNSTQVIMKNVVYALIPAALFSVFTFGLSALLVLGTAVASCLITEYALCKVSGRKVTTSDYSAVITGLLLGMTLPPAFPLWMVACGGFIAIGLGKFVFGGLGYNVFNPALVGRAVLQAAFPVAITTWTDALSADRFTSIPSSVLALPFMEPVYDITSGATPLSAFKFDHHITPSFDLAFGMIGGSLGETSSFLILAGGVYLMIRKMANWKITVSILTSVIVLSGALHLFNAELYPSPLFMLFSGGLMLGACFMATDMVGSPLTTKGIIVYGAFIGILVVVIRIWGGLPEGVMYAILLGNALSPQLDQWLKPRVYGTSKKKKS